MARDTGHVATDFVFSRSSVSQSENSNAQDPLFVTVKVFQILEAIVM
jgi:hypothetical protein